MTNIVDTIKKRINDMRMIKQQEAQYVYITEKEAEQLGNIKTIDEVNIIVEGRDTLRPDCFAYLNRRCYSLNKLECKNKKCKFYKNKEELTIEEIENEIKIYEEGKFIKGVALR